MDIKDLVKLSLEARENAYAPYSNYSVGAALLCDNGKIFLGANIENASYGATVCAERVAVFKAVSEGNSRIRKIAIAGGRIGEEPSDYAFPCGICRQILREFSNPKEFIVIVVKNEHEFKLFSLEDLLPSSFGPDNLK